MTIDWTKEEIGKNQCEVIDVNELKELNDLKNKWEQKLSAAQKIINRVDELGKLKKQALIKEVDEQDNLIIKRALKRVFYTIPGYSDERSCAELAKSRLEYEIKQKNAANEGGYHYTKKYPELEIRVWGEVFNGKAPFETKKAAHRPARTVSRSHFIRALRFKLTLEEVGKMVAKDTERLDDAAIRKHCAKSKKYLEIPSHLKDLLHEVACELYVTLKKNNGLEAYLWGETLL